VVLVMLSSCARFPDFGRGGERPAPLRPIPQASVTEVTVPRPATRSGAASPRLIGRRTPRMLGPIDPGTQQVSPVLSAPAAAGTTPVEVAEGAMIVARAGRIRRDAATGRWRFTFDPAPGRPNLPTMEVLPGLFLAEMEAILARGAPQPVTFHVTAEVTRYRGRAYMMIRRALAEHVPTGERPSADRSPPAPRVEMPK